MLRPAALGSSLASLVVVVSVPTHHGHLIAMFLALFCVLFMVGAAIVDAIDRLDGPQ